MQSNDYIAPVDHGVFSATGSVALGTASGALRSMGKTLLWAIGIGAAIGLGVALLPTGALAGTIAGSVWTAIGGAAIGAALGGVVGSFAAPLAGLIGGGKGAVQSHERVSLERGAAKQMEAQVAAYQAMAVASSNEKYNFPPQGSRMNPASARIQVDTLQDMGAVQGQQLQRA